MIVETSHLIWGVGTLVTILGGWFGFKYGLDRVNEKITEDKRQIEALWKWINQHEKEANEMRERFNKDISRLEGANLVQTEQFKQILNLLEDIKERLSDLENRGK